MVSVRIPRRAVAAVAALLLPACDDLLPARPQAAPPPAVVTDSAGARTPKPASRKPAAPARREATGAEAEAAFDQIRRTLRSLVAAEQGFYAENGTYTEDLARLRFRPSGETQVRLLWVSRRGWAASGTHPALPGRDCVTFVGAAAAPPTTLRYVRSGREGVVVCDAQPRARPQPAPAAASPERPAPPPAAADTSSALDAVNPVVQMKVDLRNLVQAQTAYFGTQGLYSRRTEQLQLQFGWQRGVKITLLHADQRSWSARATHVGHAGKSCVVWYGTPPVRPATLEQRKVPPRPGVPACDE
jgi:hypothetical protein